MTAGLTGTQAAAFLDALGNATNVTAPTAFWIKLHTGDPGSAGTSNAAANTTRKQASFGAASSGSITSDADTTWNGVSNTETYTHISAWTASSGGTFYASGALASSVAVTAGQDFSIATGNLTMTLTPIAA